MAFMLTSIFAEGRLQALYAECHYAEGPYAECRYAECRGAPFRTLLSQGACHLHPSTLNAGKAEAYLTDMGRLLALPVKIKLTFK